MRKGRKKSVRPKRSFSRKRKVLLFVLMGVLVLLVITLTLPPHAKAITVSGRFGCEVHTCSEFCTALRLDPVQCSGEQATDKDWMACACGD